MQDSDMKQGIFFLTRMGKTKMRKQDWIYRITSCCIASAFAFSAAAQPDILIEFSPDTSPGANPAEFEFFNSPPPGTSFLTTGPGSVSNGDGALPGGSFDTSAVASGLTIQTPFTVAGASAVGGVIAGDGSTLFADATLELTGLADTLPATVTAGVLVTQVLGNGTFRFISTTDADASAPVVLLEGTISDAFIVGILGTSTGSSLSASISYTGGIIFDATGITAPTSGDTFSISLSGIDDPLSIAANLRLDSFVAQGTGQFTIIPEPGTVLMLIAGTALVSFRRRQAA